MDDEVESETPLEVSGSCRIHKKETSDVWKYFTKIGTNKDGFEKAACDYCAAEYVVGRNPRTQSSYGTSHLGRHILSCKIIANSKSNEQHGKSRTTKINQEVHREKLAQAIVYHDLPYSFVEYEMIRDWISYISLDVMMNSRNTAVSDVQKMYVKEKEKLKQIMSSIPNRVCLTSDVWTTTNSEGYICLTAHFVDENWRLISKILNFFRMKPPHTGVELETTLFDCLKQWGIKKKVFSITLDNAANNDNMQLILINHLRLQNNLLCDGEFFHICCSTHILNLIVQEGLKVASEALYKIRESVKYVKASDGRMTKFQDCVEQAGIDTNIGLRIDVSTRWNSTYLMLESAFKYEKAFDILQLLDRNYKCCLTQEEWRRGERICEFLEPFYETTNMISGSSYPTSNLYFMQVWKIECILNENLCSDDDVIWDISRRMKEKFDKYWKEYSVVLAFGAILDPRLKFVFLESCYTKLDPLTSPDKVINVREKIEKLYEEYVSNLQGSSSSHSLSSNKSSILHNSSGEGGRPKKSKLYIRFEKFENESMHVAGKSELNLYLDEPKVKFGQGEDFDVLNFWKLNESRFTILSIMARDVLSIPITTVASESAFSIGGRVLTKYRSSTLPKNIQMLICTRNWLHGFTLNPDDEDDCKITHHEALTAESQGPSRISN